MKPTRRTFLGILCSIPVLGLVVPKKAVKTEYTLKGGMFGQYVFNIILFCDGSRKLTFNDIELVPLERAGSYTRYGIRKGIDTQISCKFDDKELHLQWIRVIQNRETGEFL